MSTALFADITSLSGSARFYLVNLIRDNIHVTADDDITNVDMRPSTAYPDDKLTTPKVVLGPQFLSPTRVLAFEDNKRLVRNMFPVEIWIRDQPPTTLPTYTPDRLREKATSEIKRIVRDNHVHPAGTNLSWWVIRWIRDRDEPSWRPPLLRTIVMTEAWIFEP